MPDFWRSGRIVRTGTSDTPSDFRVIPRLRRRRDRVRGGTILPERHLPPWTVQDPNRSGSRPRLAARPPLHECVLFPGPLPGARQENPRVDGLHMTHRRAGDAARVGEPDDRSHLRGGHGSKGARGRRPGEGGASSRVWDIRGSGSSTTRARGPGHRSPTRGPRSSPSSPKPAEKSRETGEYDTQGRRI